MHPLTNTKLRLEDYCLRRRRAEALLHRGAEKRHVAPDRGTPPSSSLSSSSSSTPYIFGNGPAPCQGASLHPAVWLASCKSEEASGQVIEPAHPSISLLAPK
ncbi:hypothetical protein Q5P01_004975 [Channa striata]|uniref:Uncharacterized protein n=1 Tax=Channa striata TaxID=64152 RepID=A0AA88T0V1_CHASR|nr:hypothetical protein Q5P01_004975 [Channa striata]